MGDTKTPFLFRPTTIRLFTVIVFISTVILSFSYYHILKREKVLLQNKADEYIDIITSALEVPLWDVDRENIRNICTYFFRNDLVVTVSLTGISGENLFEKTKESTIKKKGVIHREKDIFYHDEPIGNIKIGVTQKYSDAFIKRLLVASIGALVISIMGLAAAMTMITRRTRELETSHLALQKEMTERKEMQRMMIQTEKMMSVGGLAAGMAHEINNPLAGIMQNIQVVILRITASTPANEAAAREAGITLSALKDYMERRKILRLLNNILVAGGNAAKIVENMLSFARKSDSSKLNHNAAELFSRALSLASNDYDLKRNFDFKQIKIVNEVGSDFSEIFCEENKFIQVLLNIIRNAAEAMHDAKIRTRPPTLTFRLVQLGGTAQIEIEDNGPGIDEETRKRIFEPFFTTKHIGKGTGLGLSLSYFIIVDDHGGEMEVESTPGKGTRFIIRLPQGPDKNGSQ